MRHPIPSNMSDPSKAIRGWAVAEQASQPANLRSPRERNLLQFSPFVGLEEAPRSSKGRFRRVQSRVSGSNRPALLTSLTSRQLSQMSSTDSAEGASVSIPVPRTLLSPPFERNQEQGVQDNNSEPEASREENSTSDSHENCGFSQSMTISLDQSAFRGKDSSIMLSRRREASEAEVQSDMVPSQISAQSKPYTSEKDSADSIVGAGTNEKGNGNGLRSMTSSLTKKLSQDGKLIRNISGLLSRAKKVAPPRQETVAKHDGSDRNCARDAPDRSTARDARGEQGLPVRKASVRGLFGLKDKLPSRKRSFIMRPQRKIDKANKSADCDTRTEQNKKHEVDDRDIQKRNKPLTEEDVIITAAIGGLRGDVASDAGVSSTEDELARRAIQIEKFLNSAEFV